jgi:hypothetical protein
MKQTRKYKKPNNEKTRRLKYFLHPHLKLLQKGYSLYAAKNHEGDKLLEYKENAEKESGDHCMLENSSWFGDLDVAKSYKTKDNHIYKWSIKKPTYLLKITNNNEIFIRHIFKNTRIKLVPTIELTNKQLTQINYEHSYLNMTDNEKALFEFEFAFGYITIKEQFEFLKLVKYLIENKFIELDSRTGNSILSKLKLKINYYKVASLVAKKTKYNRLSFYYFDKYAIMNLCKIVYHNKIYNISGVYQKNTNSFWFPDLLVYKMNIQEYILFNPSHNLVYNELIE